MRQQHASDAARGGAPGRTYRSSSQSPGRHSQVENVRKKSANPTGSPSSSAITRLGAGVRAEQRLVEQLLVCP